MTKMLKVATVVALGRSAMRRIHKLERQRRANRRRNLSLGVLSAGLAAGAYFVARAVLARHESGTQWPSRKKMERDRRVREARRLANTPQDRKPAVHVEKNASTTLKSPLGDLAH